MRAQQTQTIRQIKQQAQQIAKELSVPQFWLTDWLLHVLNKPKLFLITDEQYQLTTSELEAFNTGVAKMQQGTPLAYLTGSQAFWSLEFAVNAHTLIPRPDTEVLIEQVLDWIQASESMVNKPTMRLLDLGTGSGCIAISLAYELASANKWQVVAVDLSNEALNIAHENAMTNNTAVEFIQSSWYEQLSTDSKSKFDVIVSNPPYIDEADTHLQTLKAEPISALSAPNHGLADIEHIVKQAPNYLKPNGLLAIEHGHDQGDRVRELFASSGFKQVKTVKDYGDNDRVTLGQLV